MNVRTPATALIIALIAGACGLTGDVTREVNAAAGQLPDAEHEVLPDGTIVLPDGSMIGGDRIPWGDSLEEYAAQVELTVLVRATDNTWTQAAPGLPPRSQWPPDDDDDVVDAMSYHWREFEVVEVLSGSYDHETLNYGNFIERILPGETYLLILGVMTIGETGEPRYSDQHFGGPVPPYLLTADNILTSTDPISFPELDETLTLSEARVRLGDTDSQERQTAPLEAPTPLPSLDEPTG